MLTYVTSQKLFLLMTNCLLQAIFEAQAIQVQDEYPQVQVIKVQVEVTSSRYNKVFIASVSNNGRGT